MTNVAGLFAGGEADSSTTARTAWAPTACSPAWAGRMGPDMVKYVSNDSPSCPKRGQAGVAEQERLSPAFNMDG
jgi:hypothetical protein